MDWMILAQAIVTGLGAYAVMSVFVLCFVWIFKRGPEWVALAFLCSIPLWFFIAMVYTEIELGRTERWW